MRRRAVLVATLTLLALPGTAAANHNLTEFVSTGPSDNGEGIAPALEGFMPEHKTISDDGSTVVFATTQQLVPEDTDTLSDVYEYRGGLTSLVSASEVTGRPPQHARLGAGGVGGAVRAGTRFLSADGSRVWFTTSEQLTADDTDANRDVYERYQGDTRLISTGPQNANAGSNSDFVGASDDGSRVFFTTHEGLVPEDTDYPCLDMYQRSGNVTTRVTSNPNGCITQGVSMILIGYYEPAGTPTWVLTTETPLGSPQDTDSEVDAYMISGGVTTLLSDGQALFDPNTAVTSVGVSDQGAEVYFTTAEALTVDDTDGRTDVYERSNGSTVLVSTGPAAGSDSDHAVGCWFVPQGCLLASQTGGHVFFSTAERLTVDDTDQGTDVYEHFGGVTRLVSAGQQGCTCTGDTFARGASTDGSRVFFETQEALVPGDTDSAQDVYERFGGVTTLVSTGNVGGYSNFHGMSDDGTRVFFGTADSLVPSDTCCFDLYERLTGLVPNGPAAYYVIHGQVGLLEASADGRSLAVQTSTQLSTLDTDAAIDIYKVSTTPNPYARPKAATPINVAFVPAYQDCGAPNRAHAAPLSFGSCSPAAQTSGYLTVGTPDANMAPAKSAGNLRLVVQVGDPSNPAVDADAHYEINVTDVRNKSDLSDYTGALKLDAALQITDKNNPDPDSGDPNSGTRNATGSTSLPVTVPCASTSDTTVGSTCSITTSANTISPGAVVETKRAIWELGQVRVFDGGADGNPGTSDGDGLFMVQGVFIP